MTEAGPKNVRWASMTFMTQSWIAPSSPSRLHLHIPDSYCLNVFSYVFLRLPIIFVQDFLVSKNW